MRHNPWPRAFTFGTMAPARRPPTSGTCPPQPGLAPSLSPRLGAPGALRRSTAYLAVVPATATASGEPLPAVGAAFAAAHIAAAFARLGTVGWADVPDDETDGIQPDVLRLACGFWRDERDQGQIS